MTLKPFYAKLKSLAKLPIGLVSIFLILSTHTAISQIQDKQTVQDSTEDNQVHFFVQEMPVFPGNLNTWIYNNIRYPEAAKEKKLEGKVYVRFIIEKDGKTRGENTDGKGFVKAISEVTSIERKKLVVFGAGGAARAICVEMALAGASEITVLNIDETGKVLADLLNRETPAKASFILWDHKFNIPADTDIVINATSVGLYPNVEQRLNINVDTLKSHMIVADCIPNPAYTHFVKDATSKGCRHVLPGMNMLVNQAVIALKYWTGEDVDAEVMRQELKRVLGL